MLMYGTQDLRQLGWPEFAGSARPVRVRSESDFGHEARLCTPVACQLATWQRLGWDRALTSLNRTEPDDRRGPDLLHLVASTGRTATSLIAASFDRLPGIAACHEGHRGDDDGPDLLPLINLENFQVFKDPLAGPRVVEAKRNRDLVGKAEKMAGTQVVVDVAYYNAIVGEATLAAHDESRMVGIIRDCESFVRSVTWLEGTDPAPVGWPDPGKPLSTRERFISMGRLRPTQGPDAEEWESWGAIERNIWLWKVTNHRLCDVKDRWPDRVTILDFGVIRDGTIEFLRSVLAGLDLLRMPGVDVGLEAAAAVSSSHSNERSGGYQVGGHQSWTPAQRALLHEANTQIEGRMRAWSK